METFSSDKARIITLNLIDTFKENADYLSELDGAVGDGDHGINLRKGFMSVDSKIKPENINLAYDFQIIGSTLMNEIGGAMGPLYGVFFIEMAGVCKDEHLIDKHVFAQMLGVALARIQDLGNAKVGDKTIVDTLSPAHSAFLQSIEEDLGFVIALNSMLNAAQEGLESTRYLEAKIGRASRLGKRSIGHLDAGAASCYLILKVLANSIVKLLERGDSR